MSKLMGFVAVAALLASVPAFAQSSTAPAPAAPADSAGAPAMGHHHHRGHHEKGSDHSRVTDNDADKLNGCAANATPTQQDEQCLRQAENSRN